jgi:hypothetical protein
MKVTRTRTTKGITRRIGRLCWFLDPRTGECVEGFYRHGRRVERHVKGTTTRTERRDPTTGQLVGVDYDCEMQIFRLPASVPIHFGMAPTKLLQGQTCGHCGEPWPCTVITGKSRHNAEEVARHHVARPDPGITQADAAFAAARQVED